MSKIYVGVNHDTANEYVVISETPTDMEYEDSCENSDSEYVIWCDDENVGIFTSKYIRNELKKAQITAKQLLNEYEANGFDSVEGEYIDGIPYMSLFINDESDIDYIIEFVKNPEKYYKEYIDESYTDNDSSSGGAWIVLNKDGIKYLANGDLDIYYIYKIKKA